MNNEDTSDDMIKIKGEKHVISFVKKKKNIIFWFVYILITLYPIHNILSYFFADYYNISNYNTTENIYNEKESDNYIRKKHENKKCSWIEFPKEQFAIFRNLLPSYIAGPKYRQLSLSNSVGYWANLKYGPVPNGVPVSTYEGKGTDSYIVDSEIDFLNEKEIYYYKKYSYRNSISTYAISSLMSFLPNYEWLYVRYLNDIVKQLNAVGINWKYIKIDDKTAIAYCDKEHNIRRVIVCANGNAYLLETESTENLLVESNNLCSSVSLSHFHIVGGKWKIITMFCLLIFCIILTIVSFVNKKQKYVIHNRYAYSLFCIGIGSIVICFVIAICQSYMLYTNYTAFCSSVFCLIGALISVTFIITPLCLFYYRKSKERWKYDYIVPSFLEKAHLDFIKSDFKKKIYVSYICYPTMLLSLLPFGFIIVLLVFVPILLICTFIIWYNKWLHWVSVSKMYEDITKE